MAKFKRTKSAKIGWFSRRAANYNGHGYLLATHPSNRIGWLYRNTRCYCGSGRKYKRCCYRKDGLGVTA